MSLNQKALEAARRSVQGGYDTDALDIAITAYLAHVDVPVKVKPLEWGEARVSTLTERFTASTIFGIYEVLEWSDGDFGGTFPAVLAEGKDVEFSVDTMEAAKEAAQADYEARIRSALVAEPAQPADYFGQLVEQARTAAEKAIRKFPQPNYVTLKIAEEAGEVVRGAVHYAEGRMEWSEVEGEIVQLLAMLIRFVTEGDQINGVVPPVVIAAQEAAR